MNSLFNPSIPCIKCGAISTTDSFLDAVAYGYRMVANNTCGVHTPDTLWIPPSVRSILSSQLVWRGSSLFVIPWNIPIQEIKVEPMLDLEMVLFEAKPENMEKPNHPDWLTIRGKLLYPLSAIIMAL